MPRPIPLVAPTADRRIRRTSIRPTSIRRTSIRPSFIRRVMRTPLLGVIAGLAALTAFVAVPPSTSADAVHVSPPKHVVLIDWDGFDPDYIGQAPMPHLDALIERGSLSIARGTYKTISNPSRASMSTGAYPETHGNVAYVYDPQTNRVQGQSRFLAAETIAQRLAAEGRTFAAVQWYMVQDHGATYGDPEHLYVQPGGSCAARVDAATDILHRRPVDSNGTPVTVPKIPDFLAVYCSDVDGLGHNEGPNSPNLPPLLTEMDRQLGRLVQATKDVGSYGETAFILTSDHGMTAWTRTLQPQVLKAVADLGYHPEIVTSGTSPKPETDVIIVPFIRTGTVALRGAATTEEARRAIVQALQQLPEVDRVLGRDDLRALHASEKEGDLVIEAKPPWAFATGDLPDGKEQGSHASLAEIEVPLVLSGKGFCRSVAPHSPELVDIAPTIAALLGTESPAQAQGRPLSEILGPPTCRPTP
jgi:arylsulfatase A-like enzyme